MMQSNQSNKANYPQLKPSRLKTRDYSQEGLHYRHLNRLFEKPWDGAIRLFEKWPNDIK